MRLPLGGNGGRADAVVGLFNEASQRRLPGIAQAPAATVVVTNEPEGELDQFAGGFIFDPVQVALCPAPEIQAANNPIDARAIQAGTSQGELGDFFHADWLPRICFVSSWVAHLCVTCLWYCLFIPLPLPLPLLLTGVTSVTRRHGCVTGTSPPFARPLRGPRSALFLRSNR